MLKGTKMLDYLKEVWEELGDESGHGFDDIDAKRKEILMEYNEKKDKITILR